MKNLIIYAMLVLLNLPGLAFSQNKNPDSKISTTILINISSFPGSKLSIGLEADYNLNKKISAVIGFNSFTKITPNQFGTTSLNKKYFSITPRIILFDSKVKFFFETGPVVSFSKQKYDGTDVKYILNTQRSENEPAEVVTYKYSSEGKSYVDLGITMGAGAEIKLSSLFSAVVKGNQLFFSSDKNAINLSTGIKYNF